jgi:hypothetical protein
MLLYATTKAYPGSRAFAEFKSYEADHQQINPTNQSNSESYYATLKNTSEPTPKLIVATLGQMSLPMGTSIKAIVRTLINKYV